MAATSQVQILVWTQGLGSACRHAHVVCACMSDNYVFYDLLAGSSDRSALYVSLVLDNLQRRPPPGVLGFLVPLHFYWLNLTHGPHRLVVRTSRCGRNNPGSNPGADKHFLEGAGR